MINSKIFNSELPDIFHVIRRLFHCEKSVQKRRDMEYLSVFIPNAGKYGPEKIPYLDTFHSAFL